MIFLHKKKRRATTTTKNKRKKTEEEIWALQTKQFYTMGGQSKSIHTQRQHKMYYIIFYIHTFYTNRINLWKNANIHFMDAMINGMMITCGANKYMCCSVLRSHRIVMYTCVDGHMGGWVCVFLHLNASVYLNQT